jgi:hypothetical protein
VRVYLLVVIFLLLVVPPRLAVTTRAPDSKFDEYGTLAWEDEKARLDNFAIQLQNKENLIGYILVLDAVGGCPGEAQARAIRAKRYVVEHRGLPWNRVIWKVEGYQSDVSTGLVLAPREVIVPYPLRYTFPGKDGPLTKRCQKRLLQIANSR